MADVLYNMQQAQEKLGVSEDTLRQWMREGKLRYFQDGGKVMFKADEINTLATGNELETPASDITASDSDAFDLLTEETGSGLGIDDSGEPIALTPEDSALAGGPDAMLDLNLDSGEPIGLTPEDSSEQISLAGNTAEQAIDLTSEDTGPSGLSEDLANGQSGSSIGLMPGDSADQISLDDTTAGGDKDDTVVTTHGVNVMDDSSEDMELADPMAQTQLAPDLDDQVDLDSSSSGSGLLDLSREADDTSLGAELLEEIYPGADEGAVETQAPDGLQMAAQMDSFAASSQVVQAAPPQFVTAVSSYDSTSGVYGVVMVVPLLVLMALAAVASAQIAGAMPQILSDISGIIWYVVGGVGLVTLGILGVGVMLAGRSGSPAAPKEKKAKKEKKVKKKKK